MRRATITVIGKDRSGVIARFTNLLFERGANIEALEEQVSRGQFSMTLQASWPKGRARSEAAMGRDLAALAAELGMTLSVRMLEQHARPRMAVMVTKESHCLEALLAAKLPCDTVLAIGNYPALRPLAAKAGVPFTVVPWTDRGKAEERVHALLGRHEVDFVVLARFMKILSPQFVWRWKNKIINIHPSLLPSFPGANAYRQAFEKGVRVAGVTAHLVTPDLDEGPILAQEAFPIGPRDSVKDIAAKGRVREARALLSAIRLFLRSRFDIFWGKVHEME